MNFHDADRLLREAGGISAEQAEDIKADIQRILNEAQAAALKTCRTALRQMVHAMERSWKEEGWDAGENSMQVPLHELAARNEARRVLGEPWEAEGR
jgi:hypothetical protein